MIESTLENRRVGYKAVGMGLGERGTPQWKDLSSKLTLV